MTNLPNEQSNRIIVQSSIAMAHSLGLSVVAEGAEDEITCALLAEAGCDLIQGYYLSKPMAADDLKRWLLQGAALEFTPLGHRSPRNLLVRLLDAPHHRLSPSRRIGARRSASGRAARVTASEPTVVRCPRAS